MKNPHISFVLKALLLFIVSAYSQAQSPDSTHTLPANWTRVRTIDVKHIAIDLRFDWQKRQAYGKASITFSPFHPTKTIALDAGMLTVNSIRLANKTPLTFTYDGGDKDNGLAIVLDRTYETSENVTVVIDYHTNWVNESDPNAIWGSFGKGIRFFGPTTTEPKKRKQIWSVGDPESNRYWFPSYDYPNDLRTTEFTATVERPLIALSNGRLIKTTENADGTRSFHWKMETPYSNYLTSFVVGEYVAVHQSYNNIQLQSLAYPDEAEAAKASIARLPDMVNFYSIRTGVTYPYPAYTQVFVQDFPGWMGNNTLSTITENMVDDKGTHADFLYLWDITESEALAHQWFGNYVSCNDWAHIWLTKSFAHYFSGLYNEFKNGRDEFLSYQLLPDHTTYLNDWQAGFRQPLMNKNYDDVFSFTNSNLTYFHGSSVLHMLRKQLGDEIWWKAINLYLTRNAGQTVNTEDLRKAVEAASGNPMDWFFDQWVYKAGHPVFEVTKHFDVVKKQLVLEVRQTQKKDSTAIYPEAGLFAGKVSIEIDDRIETVWLEARAENILTFPAQQSPRLVNFDFESTWVKELQFEKRTDELLYQFQHSKDVLARLDAMSKLATLVKNEKTASKEREKICAAFRHVITSDAYWRLRLNVMSQLQNILVQPGNTNVVPLDQATQAMLDGIIKTEKSWVRSGALRFLGATRDPRHADIYIDAMQDSSERVVNSAAIALGKSKSPKAFDVLIRLKDRPSWKNQSLISALNGLKELRDPRALPLTLTALSDSEAPHWTLGTSVWDHRLAAAETLVALGEAGKGYPIILEQFKKAMAENDINDIFYNVLQVTTLADPRGREVFELLKSKFATNENAMIAATQLEAQFDSSMRKP